MNSIKYEFITAELKNISSQFETYIYCYYIYDLKLLSKSSVKSVHILKPPDQGS